MLRWTFHLDHRVGTPPNSKHKVAVGHKVYSFGLHWNKGEGQRDLAIDVRIFNTVSMSWTRLPSVTAGREHSELFRGRSCAPMLLIENIIYHVKNVIYAFDVDTHRWFKPSVSGTAPGVLKFPSSCAVRDSIYIYGGYQYIIQYNEDIYKLATTTMLWSLIKSRGAPLPVSGRHSFTAIGTKMFVFGGRHERTETDYDTIRVFDTETELWLSTPYSPALLPEGRTGHRAFAHDGQLYILDGYSQGLRRCPQGMWRFNPETFSWKKVEPMGKGPRPYYGRSCCVFGDRVIVFCDEYEDENDLFVLDLSPSLKTLCKLAVIHYSLEQSDLTRNIRWELATMTTNMYKDEDELEDEEDRFSKDAFFNSMFVL